MKSCTVQLLSTHNEFPHRINPRDWEIKFKLCSRLKVDDVENHPFQPFLRPFAYLEQTQEVSV